MLSPFAVILSAAKNLALSVFRAMRDSSSPGAPQNDSADGFFRSLFSPALPASPKPGEKSGLILCCLPDVEPFHHDAWRLATRVGVFEFCPERLPFAGHQGNVLVTVNGRQDSVSRLFPYGFQSDHQRRLGRGVVQLSR